jgi:prophage regulatory protein
MASSAPVRILRLPEVMRRTGDSRSGIYTKMAAGKFPKQVPIGDNAVGWVETEIDQHIADRIAERDARWQSLGDAAARVVERSRR